MTKYASVADANTGDALGTIRFNKNNDGTYCDIHGRVVSAKNDHEAALIIANNMSSLKGFELSVDVN